MSAHNVTSNPVGLPHPNPTKSYWQTPPLPIANHRSTPALPSQAHHVVIGSGITGAAIAYHLIKGGRVDARHVLMLEAGEACSRDSGRNGGHCKAGDFRKFHPNVEELGLQEAKKIWQLEVDSVTGVTEEVAALRIACDLRRVEALDVFATATQLATTRDSLAALKKQYGLDGRYSMPAKVYSADQVRDDLLMPGMLGAVATPAFTTHPYRMVCGFLDWCLARGMNLQTQTPVTTVQHEHGSWQVVTDRGVVRSDKVIMATNAYAAALYAPLANFITPLRGQAAALRPGSKIAGNAIFEKSVCPWWEETDDYFITRPRGSTGEGDIIYGGGTWTASTDDSVLEPDVTCYLENAGRRLFGAANWGDDEPALQHWSGIVGQASDERPIVGQLPGAPAGLFYCGAYDGHGMALAWRCAEALAAIVLGETVEWLPECYKVERFDFGA